MPGHEVLVSLHAARHAIAARMPLQAAHSAQPAALRATSRNNRIRASSSKNYVLFKAADLEADDERDLDLSDAVLQFGKVESG